jgi:lantibiotic modifying enzyme
LAGEIFALWAGAVQLDDDDLAGRAVGLLPLLAAAGHADTGPDLFAGWAGPIAVNLAVARSDSADSALRTRAVDHALAAFGAARPALNAALERGPGRGAGRARSSGRSGAGSELGVGRVAPGGEPGSPGGRAYFGGGPGGATGDNMGDAMGDNMGDNMGLPAGFARGLAGIVPYLFELATVSGNAQVGHMGEELLDALDRTWNPAPKSWRSASKPPADRTHSWCKGTTGMLLCYVLTAPHLAPGELTPQIRRLTQAVTTRGLGHGVSYCHGDLGALEVLDLVAQRQGDMDLAARVRTGYARLFDDVLERFAQRFDTRAGYSNSLLAGTTGIGYALIRRLSRRRPPSVLWFG